MFVFLALSKVKRIYFFFNFLQFLIKVVWRKRIQSKKIGGRLFKYTLINHKTAYHCDSLQNRTELINIYLIRYML
ncbi:hypothetical protein AAJ76_500059981 [Vairimorpha ceranae]|uniref:Uncharacterized protein n=1 Tax=Vairimorpha ceranae TaxID=40302 RepID=A0A0F9WI13_9MICR|nr:hypothetical protein AAJ76_500059981 [Vairimorpha ceranae]KKO76235.1 hypothetical protein AAJ76_500059981 [Vairimorpha ceranae]